MKTREQYWKELNSIKQERNCAVSTNIRQCHIAEGTAVAQIGRSLVRFQMVSLEIFIGIKSFRSNYGHVVDTDSNRNEYQQHFLRVKAAGV